MALIVFSHANGFPAGTYGVLLRALRERGHLLEALERFGHDPRYPVTSNWPHLVRELAEFAAPRIARHGQPAFLVGHSLGGILSLMCAARHPMLGGRPLAGVVMLDSPILGGWRARALAVLKGTRLVGRVSPGRISRRRRDRWPDAATVGSHLSTRTVFRRWDPAVFADYVAHGTHEAEAPEGGVHRVLSFRRDVETALYDTLPHDLDHRLRRDPLRCPVGFIGGTASAEMRQVGLSMTRRVVGSAHPERMRFIEGSHLFPMERPLQTAEAIDAMIVAMQRR